MKTGYSQKRLTERVINKATKNNNPPYLTMKDFLLLQLHDDNITKAINEKIKQYITIKATKKYIYVYYFDSLIEKCLRHGYTPNSNYCFILNKYGI